MITDVVAITAGRLRHITCSPRVMGTAFATGQAAGVAAALQARHGRDPGAAEVRRELERQGALI